MGFDRLALAYRAIETLVFGRDLQRARCAHLDRIAAARRAVLLGDGDGRFLARLLESEFAGEVLSVDSSRRMLDRAASRSGDRAAGRSVFCHCRAEEFDPPAGFDADAVAAHFFFDCFAAAELEPIVGRIESWLAAGGILVVSDFAVPSRGRLRRALARAALWAMYRFFRLATGISARKLPEIRALLRRRGWREVGRREWRAGFLYSSVWERPRSSDSEPVAP